MMRWNSTKTYTEEDIMRMQQEAVTRVHEFQTRTQSLPFYDVPESAITPYAEPSRTQWAQDEVKHKSLYGDGVYAESPNESGYTLPQDDGVVEPPFREVFPPAEQTQSPSPTDLFSGLLSQLNIDHETMMVLGLMFLLYNEKADSVLLVALAYLLL